jgi:ABC-type glycerol-3-phosphate transport system permease component
MANVTKWRLTILVAFIALIVNAPLISALLTSLKSDADINAYPPKFVFSPTGVHYVNAVYAAGYNMQQRIEKELACRGVCVPIVPASRSPVDGNFLIAKDGIQDT